MNPVVLNRRRTTQDDGFSESRPGARPFEPAVNRARLVEQQLRTLLHHGASTDQRLAAINAIDDDGESLTRFAGEQRVLQLLAEPLKSLVPDGHRSETLRDLACHLRDAIATRNATLVKDYQALAGVLQGVGIAVTPLKGVAALLDGCYPNPGERLINDIDVLIAPEALTDAMANLAAAGYRQAVNRFERQPPGEDMFGVLNANDFRNQVAWVDAHVPRILGPGAGFNAEVHVHVTTQRSPLCSLLDACASGGADALFHLLHNFEHSHLKDGHAALGLLDWRHLMDAHRRFDVADARADEWSNDAIAGRSGKRGSDAATERAAELTAQLMTVARRVGVEPDMAVHLWQLAHCLGTPGIADADRDERFASDIARFQRVRLSPRRQWLARQGSTITRVARGFTSKRVRDERFGPMALGSQLLRTWRFYRGEWGR